MIFPLSAPPAARIILSDPGLHRSLAGDGLATTMSALFGGPANTTYGENTGVLALSKVYDPRVIRIAAYFAILFSFSPKFAALIDSMPAAIVGGISFVLYGMISAIGIRNVVENKVDFSKPRNTIIAAVILVCALGLGDGVSFHIGQFDINLSALGCGCAGRYYPERHLPRQGLRLLQAVRCGCKVH